MRNIGACASPLLLISELLFDSFFVQGILSWFAETLSPSLLLLRIGHFLLRKVAARRTVVLCFYRSFVHLSRFFCVFSYAFLRVLYSLLASGDYINVTILQ